ncbi:MAG: hypothetical protein AAF316_01890 [Cyanobacteria bacterium P01_A01_bin.80]
MLVFCLSLSGNKFTLDCSPYPGTLTPANSKNLLGDTANEPNCPYVELVTIRSAAKPRSEVKPLLLIVDKEGTSRK